MCEVNLIRTSTGKNNTKLNLINMILKDTHTAECLTKKHLEDFE